jgi:hypothetical protein
MLPASLRLKRGGGECRKLARHAHNSKEIAI